MELDAVWDRTKEALADAYGDLVGFAIGAVEALLVVVAAALIARFLRRRAARALTRAKIDPNVAALTANAITIGTYVAAASFVLALLGASWTALGAILGASTVALSLALQDVLRNFVAGIYILLERPFAIGDRIRVKDVDGEVEAIEIRTTWLRAESGERVLVPNAAVFAEVVTNRSAAGAPRARVTLRGLATPLGDLPRAVGEALVGLDGVGVGPPRVEIGGAGVEGAEVEVSLAHEPGADVVPALVARLRERFPEASVAVERG